MEVKDASLIVIIFVTLFRGYNSSVLSGLAGFGFSPLEHDACEGKYSDSRTCYVTQVTNISCFNAVVNLDKCKKQSETFNSNASSIGEAHRFTNWTHLQAYYNRHNGGRHRPGNIGSCLELKPGVCKQYRCLKKCCEGWAEDKNGDCSIEAASSLRCQNGGTYNWKGRNCFCLPGFSGKHCEIALCPGGCLNDGQCTVTSDGDNVCVCPWNVFGENCQNIHCKDKCENGGQCVLDGPTPMCRCQPGFYGKNCAHSYTHDSTCPPPNNTICVDLNCRDECETERSCPFGHVCCSDGCCLKCVKPKSPGCLYNGVLYQPQNFFRKDNCTKCLCLHNGSTKCVKNSMSNEDCCYFNCKGPKLNCSDDVIELPVFRFSNMAYTRFLNIQAKDENGLSLKVQYSPSFLILHEVPVSRRNIETVKVLARDRLGQLNICHQSVILVDRTHPEFISCPTDSEVKLEYHKTLTYILPKARDNVGIQLLVCNPPNREIYTPGTYMISCIATDYDGNQAFCKTTVKVTRPGSTDLTAPVFLSCPLDKYVDEGDRVSWREPMAYDHTGILSLVCNYKTHTVFPVGWTRVVYTATDFNNNKGYCTFSVIVSPKSTDIQETEAKSQSSMTNSVKLIVAIVSSLVVMVVILLVMIMLWRRLRNKPVQRSGRRQSGNGRGQITIPTISNALYESTAMGLDGHPIVPTLKPPPYSPATEPPSYEEVYVNPCLQNDVSDENSREEPPPYENVS